MSGNILRSTGSDKDLFNAGRVVDRFVDSVKRPFSNTPLSTRDIENLSEHRWP
ncbi:hypothetical protein BU25DRAFT_410931 [Macroventuria anomochaeta]|uniref:Uncharacterized protein n=1 Tax=Macroventuria anomochaeta TaxID=301207 RepID=A0ACB6RZ68_9PLEO|nr:uncharacterized protein BU25DRAFT_410931 [Macroventuria anomochaeta]KAF2627320.1 hypothetical protein BU25DRAFT_410931 [Macroventuria anomochaeta]